MPPPTKMAGLGPSRRRLRKDSDEESGTGPTDLPLPYVPELTEEQKKQNAKLAQSGDLGSDRRGAITAVDRGGREQADVSGLLDDRYCNQEGTEAAQLAAQNKAQLAGWSNFGNTDIAQDGTYEALPDIAMGQSHRVGVTARLAEQGVLSLEDLYDYRRRPGIPSSMANRAGATSGATRGGGLFGSRGGGLIGRGGRPGPAPSNGSYRPLDPAVVDGEKDSRYGRAGLQSNTSSRKPKPNVRMENTTVKVTPAATRGGRNRGIGRGGRGAPTRQDRPWPPAALEYLTPELASSIDFMAFVNQQLPAKKPEAPKVEPSIAASVQHTKFQPASVPAAAMQPPTPAATFRGVSTAVSFSIVKEGPPIKQAPREEFRAPHISPSSLTDGKPSPEILHSPSIESEEAAVATRPAGLGISGVGTKAPALDRSSSIGGPTPTTIEVEIAILRKYVIEKNLVGLLNFLESLLGIKAAAGGHQLSKPGPEPKQSTATLAASKWADTSSDDIKQATNARKSQVQNPFGAKESIHGACALPASSASETKLKPTPSSTTYEGLSDSKWANEAPALRSTSTPLESRSTNGALRKPARNDNFAIIGDHKNVSRQTEDEAATRQLKARRVALKPSKDTPFKHTATRGGFAQLVADLEGMKLKPAVTGVQAALNTATACGALFAGTPADDAGNESDDSEL